MGEFIERAAALRAVTCAELPDKTADGLPIANGKRSVSDCVRRIKAIPAGRANHKDPDDCPCDKCLACELMDGVEGME